VDLSITHEPNAKKQMALARQIEKIGFNTCKGFNGSCRESTYLSVKIPKSEESEKKIKSEIDNMYC